MYGFILVKWLVLFGYLLCYCLDIDCLALVLFDVAKGGENLGKNMVRNQLEIYR